MVEATVTATVSLPAKIISAELESRASLVTALSLSEFPAGYRISYLHGRTLGLLVILLFSCSSCNVPPPFESLLWAEGIAPNDAMG